MALTLNEAGLLTRAAYVAALQETLDTTFGRGLIQCYVSEADIDLVLKRLQATAETCRPRVHRHMRTQAPSLSQLANEAGWKTEDVAALCQHYHCPSLETVSDQVRDLMGRDLQSGPSAWYFGS